MAKHHIFHTFREHLMSISNSKKAYSSPEEECTSREHHYRQATSDEKVFARLVKRIIKDILNKTN